MFHLHETGMEEYLLRYRKLKDWAEIVSTTLEVKADCLTFRTSGSSRKPKPCHHRVQDLRTEIELHAVRFANAKRILTLVPRHHIYGFLWTILLPQRLQIDVVDVRLWSASKLASQIRQGDLLVGSPPIWRFPEHIAECIRRHSGVKECAVLLMRPDEGSHLKAFIVRHDGEPNAQEVEELRAGMRK